MVKIKCPLNTQWDETELLAAAYHKPQSGHWSEGYHSLCTLLVLPAAQVSLNPSVEWAVLKSYYYLHAFPESYKHFGLQYSNPRAKKKKHSAITHKISLPLRVSVPL